MAQNQSEIRYLNPPTVEVKKKKYCRFKKAGIKYVDYKDAEFLKKFLNEQGKILPRRLTDTSQKFQKKVATAVKRVQIIKTGGPIMQVILKKDIEKLGYADDIVDVRPGYANNFLIPQGYAISATESAKKVLAETLKQRAHKEAKFVADAEALAAKLAEVTLTITAKAEEGRIFGSVTAANLAEALEKQGISVDRKNIALDAVKTVGQYEATVKIYKGIQGTVKFGVVAEE